MNSDQNDIEKRIRDEVAEIAGRGLATQDLYREVCALLFWRYGRPPTANMLYQLVRKGSMSAPAQALATFWSDLREKSRVRIEHPDLPETVRTAAGEAIGQLWRLASEQAQETARLQNAEAIAARDEALDRVRVLEGALLTAQLQGADTTQQLIAEREAHAATQRGRDEALQASLAKDDRIDALREELHGQRQALASAQAQHAQQLLKLTQEHGEAAQKAQAAAKAERDRLMRELDAERTRGAAAVKEHERARAGAAEAEARLRDEIASLNGRILLLEQKKGELEGVNAELRAQRDEQRLEMAALRASVVAAGKNRPSRKGPGSAA